MREFSTPLAHRRSRSARPRPRCFPQCAVQAIDQRIDLTAMALENPLESLVAVEPSAQGAIHVVGALANVCRCVWRLSNFAHDGTCFYQRLRVLRRTFASKLRERVTQSFGFIRVHRCDPNSWRSVGHHDSMRFCTRVTSQDAAMETLMVE